MEIKWLWNSAQVIALCPQLCCLYTNPVSALTCHYSFPTDTGLLPKLPFKFGGGSSDREKGGGITLISSRGLNGGDGPSDGGITLISKKKIDTGLDFDGKALLTSFFISLHRSLIVLLSCWDFLLITVWFWRYLKRELLSQSSIRPSIYFSLIVKSHSNLFPEPTRTKQQG